MQVRARLGKEQDGTRQAQPEAGSLLPGESRTTVTRPGCSPHLLLPAKLPAPTLKPSCADFRIHATSQTSTFHLSSQFLLLGNPFCLMNSTPSKPGSKVTSLAKASLTPELPLHFLSSTRTTALRKWGFYLFPMSRSWHHAGCIVGAQ